MRYARIGVACLCLVVATNACQLSITATTKVERDGSGRFALRFVIDKELADLARSSGQVTPTSFCDIPKVLGSRGWTVHRSTPGGGLDVTFERPFTGPKGLDTALGQLEECLSSSTGSYGGFFRLHLERSSSFLRTSTTLGGSVDLTARGLIARSSLDAGTKRQLASFIDQTGGQFFTFTLVAELPGRVSSTEGDPSDVRGGIVTWRPRLGKTLAFRASAASYGAAAQGAAGVLVLAVAGFVAWWFIRRRRSGEPSKQSA